LGCLETFRNRQKLFRHKKTCYKFHTLFPEAIVALSELENFDDGIEELSQSLNSSFIESTLDDMVVEELQGMYQMGF
jgi:hypothetical protein